MIQKEILFQNIEDYLNNYFVNNENKIFGLNWYLDRLKNSDLYDFLTVQERQILIKKIQNYLLLK
jgi:hypothetical protein